MEARPLPKLPVNTDSIGTLLRSTFIPRYTPTMIGLFCDEFDDHVALRRELGVRLSFLENMYNSSPIVDPTEPSYKKTAFPEWAVSGCHAQNDWEWLDDLEKQGGRVRRAERGFSDTHDLCDEARATVLCCRRYYLRTKRLLCRASRSETAGMDGRFYWARLRVNAPEWQGGGGIDLEAVCSAYNWLVSAMWLASVLESRLSTRRWDELASGELAYIAEVYKEGEVAANEMTWVLKSKKSSPFDGMKGDTDRFIQVGAGMDQPTVDVYAAMCRCRSSLWFCISTETMMSEAHREGDRGGPLAEAEAEYRRSLQPVPIPAPVQVPSPSPSSYGPGPGDPTDACPHGNGLEPPGDPEPEPADDPGTGGGGREGEEERSEASRDETLFGLVRGILSEQLHSVVASVQHSFPETETTQPTPPHAAPGTSDPHQPGGQKPLDVRAIPKPLTPQGPLAELHRGLARTYGNCYRDLSTVIKVVNDNVRFKHWAVGLGCWGHVAYVMSRYHWCRYMDSASDTGRGPPLMLIDLMALVIDRVVGPRKPPPPSPSPVSPGTHPRPTVAGGRGGVGSGDRGEDEEIDDDEEEEEAGDTWGPGADGGTRRAPRVLRPLSYEKLAPWTRWLYHHFLCILDGLVRASLERVRGDRAELRRAVRALRRSPGGGAEMHSVEEERHPWTAWADDEGDRTFPFLAFTRRVPVDRLGLLPFCTQPSSPIPSCGKADAVVLAELSKVVSGRRLLVTAKAPLASRAVLETTLASFRRDHVAGELEEFVRDRCSLGSADKTFLWACSRSPAELTDHLNVYVTWKDVCDDKERTNTMLWLSLVVSAACRFNEWASVLGFMIYPATVVQDQQRQYHHHQHQNHQQQQHQNIPDGVSSPVAWLSRDARQRLGVLRMWCDWWTSPESRLPAAVLSREDGPVSPEVARCVELLDGAYADLASRCIQVDSVMRSVEDRLTTVHSACYDGFGGAAAREQEAVVHLLSQVSSFRDRFSSLACRIASAWDFIDISDSTYPVDTQAMASKRLELRNDLIEAGVIHRAASDWLAFVDAPEGTEHQASSPSGFPIQPLLQFVDAYRTCVRLEAFVAVVQPRLTVEWKNIFTTCCLRTM